MILWTRGRLSCSEALGGARLICAAQAYPRHSQTNAPKRHIHLEKYTERGKKIEQWVFFHVVTSISNVNHYSPYIVVTFNAFFLQL